MKSQLIIYSFSAFILFILFIFNKRDDENFRKIRLFLFVLTVFFTLVITQTIFGSLLSVNKLYRRAEMERIVNSLLNGHQTSKKKILIVGSSYTSRGISGKLLEQKLITNGMNYKIHQLSFPGANSFEQDYYIDQYFQKIQTKPEIVLIEIGTFENSVIIQKDNYFSPNVINYHDFKRTKYIIKTLFQTNKATLCSYQKVEHSLVAVKHFLFNFFHIGIVENLEPQHMVDFYYGFQPENYIFKDINLIISGLETIINKNIIQLENDTQKNVEAIFRSYQVSRISTYGVNDIIFFSTPSADIKKVKSINQFMDIVKSNDIDIIDGNDIHILQQLSGDYWTDFNHLNQNGALIFTNWLAEQLIGKFSNNAL